MDYQVNEGERFMKLFIVRHGQTNYNVQGLINYDPTVDVHLTQEGIAEAKDVSRQLAPETFDVVFVSELPRTHETARIIKPNAELVVDARLNDINNGYEGKLVSDFKILRRQADDEYTYRYDDTSESSKDVYERVAGFLADLRTQSYDSVLIVTSAHTWRHFRNILDHREPSSTLHENIPNAEVLVREI